MMRRLARHGPIRALHAGQDFSENIPTGCSPVGMLCPWPWAAAGACSLSSAHPPSPPPPFALSTARAAQHRARCLSSPDTPLPGRLWTPSSTRTDIDALHARHRKAHKSILLKTRRTGKFSTTRLASSAYVQRRHHVSRSRDTGCHNSAKELVAAHRSI